MKESTNNEDILNELKAIKKEIALQTTGFKNKFLSGVVYGFGGLVGATILVSILLVILRQFASVNILRPTVTRIIEIVESSKKQ
jgi:hypothetical protein